MTDEVAGWQANQPNGVRYGRLQERSDRRLAPLSRWGHIHAQSRRARRSQPPAGAEDGARLHPRGACGTAIAAALSPAYAPLPAFAAATGLRPEEWQALERRGFLDRRAGILSVRRTVSSGEVVELGKTARSRRQVPLSQRALDALNALPARLDIPLLSPSPEWTSTPPGQLPQSRNSGRPAIKAGGNPQTSADLRPPARRSRPTRWPLASPVFELARIMGTSVENDRARNTATFLDGSGASIASRLGRVRGRAGPGRRDRLGRYRAVASNPLTLPPRANARANRTKAADGDRTRIIGLEGRGSTIELPPRAGP